MCSSRGAEAVEAWLPWGRLGNKVSECPQHRPVAGVGWQWLGLLQGNRASLNEDGTVAIERDI